MDAKKCLAEFAAVAANKVKSIFAQGVYLGENTSQAASVRFMRRRRTRSAGNRTRLHYGAGVVQPPPGRCPLGICIEMGSSPVYRA